VCLQLRCKEVRLNARSVRRTRIILCYSICRLYAFVYTLIAASTVGFSGATRVHKRIEEEDRTPGGAARAIDEIGEEIATLEEEVLRPLGDGWGLALSWLVAVLLFAVLLYVPSMTKENEGRIGRIFLSVVFCSVALMVLTPGTQSVQATPLVPLSPSLVSSDLQVYR
jgi:hypothetical protein